MGKKCLSIEKIYNPKKNFKVEGKKVNEILSLKWLPVQLKKVYYII